MGVKEIFAEAQFSTHLHEKLMGSLFDLHNNHNVTVSISI